MGKQVDTAGSEIRIRGIVDVPEEVTLDASASGQFVSGMMMAFGRLEGSRTIRALRPRSVPFIQMTVDVMAAFGQPVDVSQHGNDLELHIPGGGSSAAAFDVEPDVMSANYLLAAPLVLGRAVTVEGISRDTSQGDAGMIDVLAQMGATVTWAGERVTVSHGGTALRGVSADLRDMPDMSLALGVLAALANQPSTFTGVANLRHKESDRLAVLHNELSRLGCHVDIASDDDTVRITPLTGPVPDVEIETYDDHRVALAFGLLTLRNPRLVIKNPACVDKTWPGYVDELARCHESSGGVPAVS